MHGRDVEASAEDGAIMRLHDVSKVYSLPAGDVVALDRISLEIRYGEFIAVMGPSGSGKSTLLNILGSLDVATAGEVYIRGRNTCEMTDNELTALRRNHIGFIFQQFNLIPLLTAAENVEYPIILRKQRHGPESMAQVSALMEAVGLEETFHSHTPAELSGGQQQRVAIARALANDPELLLCDEPTGNLDTRTGTLIMELLSSLNREGKTIIMVTHDANIATYAHRTIRIVDGRIV